MLFRSHPYQYGYSNPVLWTDASGACVAYGNNDCAFIYTWADLEGWFPYDYPRPPAESARRVSYRGGPIQLRDAAEWAAWCDVVTFNPGRYPNTSKEFIQAEAFAVNVLGFSLLNSNLTNDPAMLLDELSCLDSRLDDLTQEEHIRRWQILVALGMAIGQDGIDNLDLPRGGARGPRFARGSGGGGGGGRGSGRLTAPQSPGNLVRSSDPRPSQPRVSKSDVEQYANDMRSGTFDWNNMDDKIIIVQTSQGNYIIEGHHRFLASKLSGSEIPDSAIQYRQGTAPAAFEWHNVQWIP